MMDYFILTLLGEDDDLVVDRESFERLRNGGQGLVEVKRYDWVPEDPSHYQELPGTWYVNPATVALARPH